MQGVSPFSTTPGIAGSAYINIHYADEIILNFESEYSTQYIYKILGLRGSGKSVEYARIMSHFSRLKDKWKVYALAAAGDPVQTLVSALGREQENNTLLHTEETVISGNLEGGLPLLNGTVQSERRSIITDDTRYYSAENALENMCRNICSKGYKILIGIDDIAKTKEMVSFLSIIGKLILDSSINIYMVCTGLYKNIEDFVSEPHLSFFVRPKALIVDAIPIPNIVYMYKKLLSVDSATAKTMAEITCGYAWGYQLLGDLYFNKNDNEELDSVIDSFDQRMASTYDLIWNALTVAEQQFVVAIIESKTGEINDIKGLLSEEERGGYNSIRSRLINKHMIDGSVKGTVKIKLPRFKEYIKEWQS